MRKNPVLFNKMLVMGILILFIGMGINLSASKIIDKQAINVLSYGNILYVGGTGEGNYSSIQDAIDDATNGDTVFVLDDLSPYYENVIIDKEINLFGENKDTTVIDGMDESYAIDIQADNVHIKGFTIKNGAGDSHPSGIYCYGGDYDNIQIEHNIITENPYGIYFVRTDNCKISNNIIKSNTLSGIVIYISDNIECQRNEIKNNDAEGIWCVKTPNSDISYNIVTGNDWTALKISFECNYSLISNNIAYDNGPSNFGLWLFMSSYVTIINNYLNNIPAGFIWEIAFTNYCYDNLIYHNDAYHTPGDDEGASTWDDGYPSGGNYWDDYTGEDTDEDGIGDTPYTFQDGEDRYPLMEPYNDNWSPYARFSYLEDKLSVSFDASSSYDFQGSIVSYEWDFGDGTTGGGETITHDYNLPGKYEVILKVTDNDGTIDTTLWEVLLYPESDLSCEGNLIWEEVNPGETVEGSFTVKNIGIPDTLLDWEITEYPEWGEWSFNPENGTDLPGGDSITVDVEVVAPDEGNKEFTGKIKVINSEDPGDFCEIDILLKTPRDRSTGNMLLWRLVERFPLLQKLIQQPWFRL